jgi:hypothetical protein
MMSGAKGERVTNARGESSRPQRSPRKASRAEQSATTKTSPQRKQGTPQAKAPPTPTRLITPQTTQKRKTPDSTAPHTSPPTPNPHPKGGAGAPPPPTQKLSRTQITKQQHFLRGRSLNILVSRYHATLIITHRTTERQMQHVRYHEIVSTFKLITAPCLGSVDKPRPLVRHHICKDLEVCIVDTNTSTLQCNDRRSHNAFMRKQGSVHHNDRHG